MPETLLQKAGRQLAKILKSTVAINVRYRCTAGVAELKATRTKPDFTLAVASGNVSTASHREDWLVDGSDLKIDGQAIEPTRGDEIEDVATGRRWKVVADGDEPCYRWTDGQKILLRIHSIDTGIPVNDPDTDQDDDDLTIGDENDPEVP